MEYVQTVLVQIDASAMDEATRPGGLLAELAEHRNYLRQQHGFEEMQITRSINAEGNVLLVVDMEAVRAEAARPADTATQVSERLALPLLVPLGVLAFALLVVYGLSRIYLEVDSDVATPLVAGISIGVLAIAWYLSSRSSVPAWQLASIGVLAAALLTGGALFAVIEEDEGEATEGAPTAAASPTAEPSPGTPGVLAVEMGDNFFTFEGQQEPTIPVKAGVETAFDLTNKGVAIHNMRIAGVDNTYNSDDDFVSDPELISGGETGELTFQIDQAGTYDFRCDFHPDVMKGKLQVE